MSDWNVSKRKKRRNVTNEEDNDDQAADHIMSEKVEYLNNKVRGITNGIFELKIRKYLTLTNNVIKSLKDMLLLTKCKKTHVIYKAE